MQRFTWNDARIRRWMLVSCITVLTVIAFQSIETRSAILAATQIGYRDFSYGTEPDSAPTGEKPESKLWWNDGYWWGSLFSPTAGEYRIYRLNLNTHEWEETDTTLDDRSSTKADVLWDESSQKLYVVSHVFTKRGQSTASSSGWGRLYRYSYDASSQSYSLDSGFPVDVTRGKSETLTIAKDTTGQLWVTYVEDQAVMVNHSVGGDDRDWGSPFVLPVDDGATDLSGDDISAVIAHEGHIGIMWSNQKDDTVHFATHRDGRPTGVGNWQHVSAYSPRDDAADDHINLKSLQTGAAGLYAVVKTSYDSRDEPIIVLLACTSGSCKSSGDWEAHTVFVTRDNKPTRPILLIDTDHRDLHVFATNKGSGGSILHKQSDVDSIQFPDGDGTVFVGSDSSVRINNATSTKQNVNAATGIVVLASDPENYYYWHNYLALGSPPRTPTPTIIPTNTPMPTNTPTSTPTNTPTPTPADTPTNTPTTTPANTPTQRTTATATSQPPNSTPSATPQRYHVYMPLSVGISVP